MSDESYAVANDHIKAGELGKIVLAQIDYSRNYQGDFWAGDEYPIDADAKPGVNLDWKAWLGPAPKHEWDPERYFRWRRYWDYSGGIATDLFVHRATRLIKALNLTFPDYVTATGGKFEFTRQRCGNSRHVQRTRRLSRRAPPCSSSPPWRTMRPSTT